MGVSGQHHAPAILFPGERAPGTHCTGGWMGLRAGLDTEARGKILCPCRGSNPDRPVVQSVARRSWHICYCCGHCSVLCSLPDHQSQVKKAAFNNGWKKKGSKPLDTDTIEAIVFLFQNSNFNCPGNRCKLLGILYEWHRVGLRLSVYFSMTTTRGDVLQTLFIKLLTMRCFETLCQLGLLGSPQTVAFSLHNLVTQ
jgi:hypothetical protein